jgi:Flp pilus assembly protein TadG
MRTISHRRHGERGSSLIEFGLAFAVMFALFVGIFQWGYSFYIYDHLETSIRSGARYAAQKTYIPTTTSTAANPQVLSCWSDAVKNLVVYGDPATTSGTPIVPNLTTSNIVVQSNTSAGNVVPDSITVKISTTSPYALDALFTTVNFSGKPSVTFPFTGIYASAATTCQ